MNMRFSLLIIACFAASVNAGLRGSQSQIDTASDLRRLRKAVDAFDPSIPSTPGLEEARERFTATLSARAETLAAFSQVKATRSDLKANKNLTKKEKRASLLSLRSIFGAARSAYRQAVKIARVWKKNLLREVRIAKNRPRPCCKAHSVKCLSCAAGLAPEAFCAQEQRPAVCPALAATWVASPPAASACPTACGKAARTVEGTVACRTADGVAAHDRACASAAGKPAVPTRECAATKSCTWTTRWSSDAQCDAECGATGVRRLEVLCRGAAKALVDAARCDAAARPAATEPCSTECHAVDASGDPALSLAACLAKGRAAHARDATVTTRCQLRAGRYTETVPDVDGLHAVTVEPAPGAECVFDGTDAVDAAALAFAPVAGRPGIVVSAPLAGVDRRGQLVVDGQATQCLDDNQNAVGRTPCFVFDPTADAAEDSALNGALADVFADVETLANRGWATPFSAADAERYFGLGEADEAAAENDAVATSWWFDEASKRLYVDAARFGDVAALSVRAKNADRAVGLLRLRQNNAHVTVREIHFYGAACCGAPKFPPRSRTSSDLRLVGNHFLYAPERVQLVTSPRRSRGGGGLVMVEDNTFAFGENGALGYYATPAVVSRNVFLFNTLSGAASQRKGVHFTVSSLGHNDVITDNTFLFNGEAGGIHAWARGYRVQNNLFLGQSFLSRWKDSACVHAQIGGQMDADFSDNWFLGPSNVRGVRLDTSKTATVGGRKTTVRGNVGWVSTGSDFTVKGDYHTIERNTVKEMNVVWSWGAIANHNANSVTALNAGRRIFSRGSKAGGALPGDAHDNVSTVGLAGFLEESPAAFSAKVAMPASIARPHVFDFRPKEGSPLALENGEFAGAYDLEQYRVPGVWEDLDTAFPTVA